MAQKNVHRILHICVSGESFISQWKLITELSLRHQVTLLRRKHLQDRFKPVMKSIDVLMIDSYHLMGPKSEIKKLLDRVKEEYPRLCVVLMNGGLSQEQITIAFQAGVRDYFSEPYQVDVILERLEILGAQVRAS